MMFDSLDWAQKGLKCLAEYYDNNSLRMQSIKQNYHPSRIIKNEKATVVFWDDGSKTIVKRSANDPDDDYAAFTAAFAIKMFGSNSKVHRIADKTEVVVKKRKKK